MMLSNLFQIHFFWNAKTNKLYWPVRCRMITSKQYRKLLLGKSFFLFRLLKFVPLIWLLVQLRYFLSPTFAWNVQKSRTASFLLFAVICMYHNILLCFHIVFWSLDVPHVVAFVSCILSIFLSFSRFFVSFNLTLVFFTVSPCRSCCTLRYHNKKQCDPLWFVKNRQKTDKSV